MNTAEFAEFWRRQGCRVLQIGGEWWYSPAPLVYMSLPYHRLRLPSRSELSELLLHAPAAAARFQNPLGANGGLFICSDRDYSLASLHKKARNQTRRGLESCRIERLDFAELARRGLALHEATLRRQGRRPYHSAADHWRRYCDAAARTSGFESWVAWRHGRLAAFLVGALVEDHFSILHQSSSTDLLAHCPNNALTFSVTRLKLALPEVACVSYGLKSLDDAEGVERFKHRMGFRLRPSGDCVVFNPLLRPLLTASAHLVHRMARRRAQSDFWRKASAVLARTRAS
jgi:Acetyltransferase (GNAT) domain